MLLLCNITDLWHKGVTSEMSSEKVESVKGGNVRGNEMHLHKVICEHPVFKRVTGCSLKFIVQSDGPLQQEWRLFSHLRHWRQACPSSGLSLLMERKATQTQIYSSDCILSSFFFVSFLLLSLHIFSPTSCPHYLSLVYSITFPPVLMPSCLLVLIFIYRFSSFSLPFLYTDGTLQLASHSTSCLTSPKVNAFHSLLPFFWYNTIYTRTMQKPKRPGCNNEHTLQVKRS